MSKQAPSFGRLAVMVLFALSCFGLLLFVWQSFGGPVPLRPQGWQAKVPFEEATQLAPQVDVRVSGVPIGRVASVEPTPDGRRTLATLQIDERYAPLRRDTRAVLRQKTLLGETYVELTPGSPEAPPLEEGATLPAGQVRPTVELDEVLRSLDADTRRRLQQLLDGMAGGVRSRAADISDAVGNYPATAAGAAGVLAILDGQRRALAQVVRDGGTVLGAAGRQREALQTLVRSGERVARTTAARERGLRELVHTLPTFLAELRSTLAEAEVTAGEAAPTVRALRPVAPLLRPSLRDAGALAVDVERLLPALDRTIRLARPALPATTRTLRAAQPLVRVLADVGRDLIPVVDHLGLYRAEVVTMVANVAAATQDTFRNPGAAAPLHYIRILAPFWNEAFVQYPQRLPSNRYNPYFAPRALEHLADRLRSFACDHLDNPQQVPQLGSSPPCTVQEPPRVQGRATAFPRLQRAP